MSAGERLDEFETLKAQVAEARERVERDLQELASRLSTRNLKAEATDAIGSWARRRWAAGLQRHPQESGDFALYAPPSGQNLTHRIRRCPPRLEHSPGPSFGSLANAPLSSIGHGRTCLGPRHDPGRSSVALTPNQIQRRCSAIAE